MESSVEGKNDCAPVQQEISPVKDNEMKGKEKEETLSTDDNLNQISEETKISEENKLSDETKPSKEGSTMDDANLHYEDGVCVYTDPESKCQYVWEEGKQEWVQRNNSSSFSDKDYEYDGKTYTYTDKDTNVKYSWDEDKKEWKSVKSETKKVSTVKSEKEDEVEEEEDSDDEDDKDLKKKPKEIMKQDMTKGHYGYENDTHTYTDPSDGSKYFWDKDKNAWFPKVDDDFLAQYQMNYGFIDPNENQPEVEEKKPIPCLPEESQKRKAPQEPAWFDVGAESTKVYVSGLPLDITEAEFIDLMQKCGLVMRDVDNGKMKVKIYLDPETSLPKGDALCTYIKKESVDLAINLLDDYDVRGHRISVERAKFTMKGSAYDPSLKPKKKRKKDKEKLKKIQEKLFDWRPDKMRGERSKHEKIIIIKNLFDPTLFNKDVKLILEYQQDLREECLKCGSVKKVIIYDSHPEGVAQISFKEVEAADACVQLLNGRWFGQRQITAETWDGKTKYKISETDEQIKARLAKWEKYLESSVTVNSEQENEEKKQEKPETKDDSVCESDKSNETKIKTDEVVRDSDNDTRSSVGSDYETDEET